MTEACTFRRHSPVAFRPFAFRLSLAVIRPTQWAFRSILQPRSKLLITVRFPHRCFLLAGHFMLREHPAVDLCVRCVCGFLY